MAHERSAYIWVDAVRAFAAAAVMWQHCLSLFLGPDITTQGGIYRLVGFTGSFGRDAVMIFFVISGFWISRSVGGALAADRWSWTDYLVNRLSRLWTVLLPALLIGGALDLIGRLVVAPELYRALPLVGEPAFDALHRLMPLDFVGNMLFLQHIAVPPWGTNGPLWTLACEAWYYLWYPALLLVVRRPRSITTWVLLAIGAAVAVSSRQVTILFGCWLVGAAVQAIDARWQARPPVRLSLPWRVAIMAGGLMLWAVGEAIGRIDTMNWYVGSYAVALGAGAAMLAVLRTEPRAPRGLNIFATYGAGSSFSLYAVHLPILIFAKAALVGTAILPTTIASVLLAAGLAASVIGAAWLFSCGTEAKTGAVRARVRRLLPRRAAAA